MERRYNQPAHQVFREATIAARVTHYIHHQAVCVLFHESDLDIEGILRETKKVRYPDVTDGFAARLVCPAVERIERPRTQARDETLRETEDRRHRVEIQNLFPVG